jgi:hypothetical protein
MLSYLLNPIPTWKFLTLDIGTYSIKQIRKLHHLQTPCLPKFNVLPLSSLWDFTFATLNTMALKAAPKKPSDQERVE